MKLKLQTNALLTYELLKQLESARHYLIEDFTVNKHTAVSFYLFSDKSTIYLHTDEGLTVSHIKIRLSVDYENIYLIDCEPLDNLQIEERRQQCEIRNSQRKR